MTGDGLNRKARHAEGLASHFVQSGNADYFLRQHVVEDEYI
jgi:hypothetical protein